MWPRQRHVFAVYVTQLLPQIGERFNRDNEITPLSPELRHFHHIYEYETLHSSDTVLEMFFIINFFYFILRMTQIGC